MEYLTSQEVADLLGLSKRMINIRCKNGEYTGAKIDGNKWLIPKASIEDSRINKAGVTKKSFNCAGVCIPEQHYMVPLQERMQVAKEYVEKGLYFTIHRARQYGKTTTLHMLEKYLANTYEVVSIDFQMQMSNSKFRDEISFSKAFLKGFCQAVDKDSASRKKIIQEMEDMAKAYNSEFDLVELFGVLQHFCKTVRKPVVLMIDEVDSATNNEVFMDFLAQLRGYYMNRNRSVTFQSVILAGVYDVRNLQRKIRSEEQHRDNSPWNIAVDFAVDMSFSVKEIGQMLEDYEKDFCTGMDIAEVSSEIYAYTSGYPFLVSRICQWIDQQEMRDLWNCDGVKEAVKVILKEPNSLFEDMVKKLHDCPLLKNMIYDMLMCGRKYPYNINTEQVAIGTMFGFLKEDEENVAVANRIFEIWFYNLFIAEAAFDSETYRSSQRERSKFVVGDELNMQLILERFVEHYNELYDSKDQHFVEAQGRKLFLLYIKPIINGTGNYYIESQTRSLGRTDLIIDYCGHQYIIEMKIWHGNEYNKRGETQLSEYLNDYKVQKGYMISFCFNKGKKVGVFNRKLGDRELIEAVV